MAVPVSRKKQRLSKKIHEADESSLFCRFFEKFLFRVPLALLFLAFVYVWSSSTTVFSGSIVHVCVSSRKLSNLYCLSAGTQRPNFEIPVSLANHTSSKVNDEDSDDVADSRADRGAKEDTPSDSTSVINIEQKFGNQTLEDAYKEVEDQIKTHRSWISNSSDHTTCEEKGIYVYKLPSKFNKDLLAQCEEMIPWADFCRFLTNNALGEPIESLGSGWHHTHQYSLEPIFHARILKHPCRVYDHNMAKLFYVPYYGGLDILRWHFKNVSNDVKDSLALELVRWLETQGPWYNNLGKDHVFVLGKVSWDFRRSGGSSWGTRLLELDEMKNPPPGDSPTRKSVFDSLVSGCIPVLFDPFTAYYQYPWHFPEDRDKYSVFVDKDEVRNRTVNVVERLMKIPLRERENMRRYIVFELLPGLVYDMTKQPGPPVPGPAPSGRLAAPPVS
ncbi:root hair specific 8 [Striga hermonthica]|uniref:Root hair specific 8 n=1 Tax=Striga hermonthica TaxID=68872 RepID=A0A9N7RS08_STRHE|nr:root hair specific 8 [Striga hermonthica]